MQKVCFFVAPIGTPGSNTRRRSDRVLDLLIRPTLGQIGYRVIRLDRLAIVGSLSVQIRTLVREADLVIADLTGANANVFYELGFRHAIDKPCVQLVEVGEQLPFDVADMRTIFVDSSSDSLLQAAGSILSTHVSVAQKYARSPIAAPSYDEIATFIEASEGSERDHMRAASSANSADTKRPEYNHQPQIGRPEQLRDQATEKGEEAGREDAKPDRTSRDREHLWRRWMPMAA